MDNRELVLRMEDAEAATVQAINQIIQTYNLPFFLFEPIVDKVHRQLINGKKEELVAAKSREASSQNNADETVENKNGVET